MRDVNPKISLIVSKINGAPTRTVGPLLTEVRKECFDPYFEIRKVVEKQINEKFISENRV